MESSPFPICFAQSFLQILGHHVPHFVDFPLEDSPSCRVLSGLQAFGEIVDVLFQMLAPTHSLYSGFLLLRLRMFSFPMPVVTTVASHAFLFFFLFFRLSS